MTQKYLLQIILASVFWLWSAIFKQGLSLDELKIVAQFKKGMWHVKCL